MVHTFVYCKVQIVFFSNVIFSYMGLSKVSFTIKAMYCKYYAVF